MVYVERESGVQIRSISERCRRCDDVLHLAGTVMAEASRREKPVRWRPNL